MILYPTIVALTTAGTLAAWRFSAEIVAAFSRFDPDMALAALVH